MTEFTGHLEYLIEELLEVFGVTVPYQRGNEIIENIPAIPSQPGSPLVGTEMVVRVKSAYRNYIIKSNLLVAGKTFQPKPGDRIFDGNREYKVVNGENKQCYSAIDPDETYLRIFVHQLFSPANR